MKSMIEVIRECWENRYRLYTLSVYDLKVRNSGTWFGAFWNVLNPALQIFVYWFVFAIGLRTSAPQGEHSYLIWMLMGIIPWFYISEAMNGCMSAIFAFQGVLKHMRFPVAIVPVKTVLTALINHLLMLAVGMAVFFVSGYGVGIHFFSVIYYIFASFVFLTGYAMFASAITVVFKDFQKIMAAIIRLLFYISPVLWVQDSLPAHLRRILMLNPFDYLINGYRDSILYNIPFTAHMGQGLYFWCVTVLTLMLGCAVHMRLRKRFMDII